MFCARKLTPNDLAALRASRSISIRSALDADAKPVDGKACVRITGENNEVHEFPTGAVAITYGKDLSLLFARGTCSTVLFHYPTQLTHLGSVLRMLKVGDEVTIVWGVGAFTSESLEGVGVAGDTVSLHVTRKVKKEVETYVFLLDVSMATSHLTRMITPRP